MKSNYLGEVARETFNDLGLKRKGQKDIIARYRPTDDEFTMLCILCAQGDFSLRPKDIIDMAIRKEFLIWLKEATIKGDKNGIDR